MGEELFNLSTMFERSRDDRLLCVLRRDAYPNAGPYITPQ